MNGQVRLVEEVWTKKVLQRCMGFTEKIVVGKFFGKVMHSGKVMHQYLNN